MPADADLRWGGRARHHYGDRVHLLDDAWSRLLLARLGHPDTVAPLLHDLVSRAFTRLGEAAAELLPRAPQRWATRMEVAHPGTAWEGDAIDPDTPVVLVDVARGGMLPAIVLQRALSEVMNPAAVRVDHVYMQRVTGADGHVAGVSTAGSKIGGPVAGRTVIVPDPMAATGSSVDDLLRLYHALDGGPPARVALLHLIVTPEYLRRITARWPAATIYALRVDRGLSPPDVLAEAPGARWDEERGLDDHDYIVPGAGGLGEILNNAYV